MTPTELAVLLDRLAPQMEGLAEPWAVIGSAALIIAGAPWDDCADVDILTTETGAVEVMGGLKVRKGGAWRPVEVPEPVRMPFGGHRWPVPTLDEQVRILKLFGRAKDLAKVRKIRPEG